MFTRNSIILKYIYILQYIITCKFFHKYISTRNINIQELFFYKNILLGLCSTILCRNNFKIPSKFWHSLRSKTHHEWKKNLTWSSHIWNTCQQGYYPQTHPIHNRFESLVHEQACHLQVLANLRMHWAPEQKWAHQESLPSLDIFHKLFIPWENVVRLQHDAAERWRQRCHSLVYPALYRIWASCCVVLPEPVSVMGF